MAAAGVDVADELADDGGAEGGDHHKLQGIAHDLPELRIDQHAGLGVVDVGVSRADPVMQGEVGQAVVAQTQHEALEEQDGNGQDDGHDQEGQQKDDDRDRAPLQERTLLRPPFPPMVA